MLVDFSGASVDAEAVRTMKEAAVFDKPYIKKSAWIGAKNFPREFYEEIVGFARREMPILASRHEAVAWQVQETHRKTHRPFAPKTFTVGCGEVIQPQ